MREARVRLGQRYGNIRRTSGLARIYTAVKTIGIRIKIRADGRRPGKPTER
jgi:hypothetical protein